MLRSILDDLTTSAGGARWTGGDDQNGTILNFSSRASPYWTPSTPSSSSTSRIANFYDFRKPSARHLAAFVDAETKGRSTILSRHGKTAFADDPPAQGAPADGAPADGTPADGDGANEDGPHETPGFGDDPDSAKNCEKEPNDSTLPEDESQIDEPTKEQQAQEQLSKLHGYDGSNAGGEKGGENANAPNANSAGGEENAPNANSGGGEENAPTPEEETPEEKTTLEKYMEGFEDAENRRSDEALANMGKPKKDPKKCHKNKDNPEKDEAKPWSDETRFLSCKQELFGPGGGPMEDCPTMPNIDETVWICDTGGQGGGGGKLLYYREHEPRGEDGRSPMLPAEPENGTGWHQFVYCHFPKGGAEGGYVFGQEDQVSKGYPDDKEFFKDCKEPGKCDHCQHVYTRWQARNDSDWEYRQYCQGGMLSSVWLQCANNNPQGWCKREPIKRVFDAVDITQDPDALAPEDVGAGTPLEKMISKHLQLGGTYSETKGWMDHDGHPIDRPYGLPEPSEADPDGGWPTETPGGAPELTTAQKNDFTARVAAGADKTEALHLALGGMIHPVSKAWLDAQGNVLKRPLGAPPIDMKGLTEDQWEIYER